MIPVEGHDGLFRDESSGAIINDNKFEYNRYIQMKAKKQFDKEELDKIKLDIEEIKSLLKNLVNPS